MTGVDRSPRWWRVLMHRLGRRPHFYRWSEIKAERRGGPPPRCIYCGTAR